MLPRSSGSWLNGSSEHSRKVLNDQKSGGFSIATPLQRLLAIHRTVDATANDRPDSPLSRSSLFTGTRLDASLGSQLRKEIATCDRVDILCSFIKWSGLRVLLDNLRELAEQTDGDGPVIRVITTSYMGATDPKAVEVLRELPRTDVRVSYDTNERGCMQRLICFIGIQASVAPTLVQRTCRTWRCLKDSNGLPRSASTNCGISGTRSQERLRPIGKTMSSKRSMRRLCQDCVRQFKGNATLQRMQALRSTSIFARFHSRRDSRHHRC